jgi:uncharacterized cysteine cluster protein YcgN (CxxCxxCC family)
MKTKSDTLQKAPFWKAKSLDQLSSEEWDALCDGCGICCLEKLRDEESGEVHLTSIACPFLDIFDCRCTVYRHRWGACPDCVRVTPEGIRDMDWLPRTCAYVNLSEGRALAWWHPLVSGDPETVHTAGISVRNKAVSGKYVHPDDLLGWSGQAGTKKNSTTKCSKKHEGF